LEETLKFDRVKLASSAESIAFVEVGGLLAYELLLLLACAFFSGSASLEAAFSERIDCATSLKIDRSTGVN
jgi:hypothetical protein